MKTITKSVFCPVAASEARKMVNEGLAKLISVADFPRGMPLYDRRKHLAYFAIEGTASAFKILEDRVVARLAASECGRPRDALIGAMATAY